MIPDRAPGLTLLIALAVSLAACSAGGELGVDLQTDLVPGLEFDAVEVSLDGAAPVRLVASAMDAYDRPRRVLERGGVEAGRRSIELTLRLGAAEVVTRRVEVRFERSHLVTVVISRDCQRTPCSSTGATECLGAMLCAPPECTSLGTPGCPDALCEDDADCSASVACAQGRCVAGACLELPRAGGCGAGEACVPERGCVPISTAPDAGSAPVDARVPAMTDAWSAADAYEPPLDCTSYQDCARCPEGWCVRSVCSPTNPTVVAHDFETSTGLHLWSLDGWTLTAGKAHTGSQALRSDAMPGFLVRSRAEIYYDLAHPASMTFWVQAVLWGSEDSFTARAGGPPGGQVGGTTAWQQYDVPLPAGAGYVTLEHAGDPDTETRTVWIDDLAIGPPLSPSADFEAGAIPAGYIHGAQGWTVEACPGGRAGQCARSGVLGARQRSALTRMVRLAADDMLTFWLRTSSHSSDRLWIRVDGDISGSPWSGETDWRLVSIPLTAGPHTIEWAYEKDATTTAGSDAVWIDDVSFGTFTPYDQPLCP